MFPMRLIPSLLLLLLPSVAFGQTIIRVDDDSPVNAATATGATWALAYPTLSDAMNDAKTAGGDYEFWVAEGSYTPTLEGATPTAGDLMQGFLGWELYGGFAGNESLLRTRSGSAAKTIINGSYSSGGSVVYYGTGPLLYHPSFSGLPAVPGPSIFDGFKFQYFWHRQLVIRDGTSPASYNPGGEIQVRGCMFTDMQGGSSLSLCLHLAKISGGYDHVVVSNNWFVNNDCAHAAEISRMNGTTDGVGLVTNNILYGNTSKRSLVKFGGFNDWAGTGASDGLMVFMNNLFFDNERVFSPGGFGGGLIEVEGSASTGNETAITHTTMSDNHEYLAGILVEVWPSPVPSRTVVYSSILFNNPLNSTKMPAVRYLGTSSTAVEIRYSNFDGALIGLVTSTSNSSADPLFLGGGYKLSSTSPCIDAGDDTMLDAANGISDLADLDGDGNTTEDIPFDIARQAREVDHVTIDTGIDDALAGHIADQGCYEVQ